MNFKDVKRALIGEPFPTSQEIHERLDKVRALAVFDTVAELMVQIGSDGYTVSTSNGSRQKPCV